MRSSKLDHIDAPAAGDTSPVRLEERPAPRWRSYAAMAAVLLIALLSVAIFWRHERTWARHDGHGSKNLRAKSDEGDTVCVRFSREHLHGLRN